MAQAVLFDTHAFIKELKESGFEEKQAEALSGAIRKVQEAHLEELASKEDIALIRRDIVMIQRDIKELEIRFEKTVSDVKDEIIK